jgi:hypothetical protein
LIPPAQEDGEEEKQWLPEKLRAKFRDRKKWKKKWKKNYVAKNQTKVRAFKLKNPGNVRQSNRRRTDYSRERCTEQSVAVRAKERREKEERERREEWTTIPGPNRDRTQFPFKRTSIWRLKTLRTSFVQKIHTHNQPFMGLY